MNWTMNAEYFAQHIQCTREGKLDCLPTVRQLAELAFAARQNSLLKMDELVEDHVRFPDPFLRKAVHLVVEISDQDSIRTVLYNYLISSNYVANHRFLSGVVVTEVMLAVARQENLEYIFTYLAPSFFGLEYEGMVVNVYQEYKQSLLKK